MTEPSGHRHGVSVIRVIVEADGGSRGNPGPGGFGALVRDPLTGSVVTVRSGALARTTNNAAEYSGLIAGLSAAAGLGAREVVVRMDSKIVIEQMTGRWQIKASALRPFAARAAALVREFARVEFEWVPRSRNLDADALVNQAMAGGAGGDGGPEPDRADWSTAGHTDVRGATAGPTAGVRRPPGAADGSWAPRLSPPTRLILVRHGATEYTAERKYSGRGDVALSAAGRDQAERLAARIAGMTGQQHPAAVISSPLSRCTQTAGAIAAALPGSVPVTTDAGLIECDFGEWEGRTFAEVRARWPERLSDWLSSPSMAPPGGESFDVVGARVDRVVTALRAAYPERVVIVVSHVSPIKLILRDALDATFAFLHRMHLDAAGISITDWWPDGGVSVRLINDTAHLS